MADNSSSYTFKEYKRNKKIFLIIKLIIGITYLWLMYLFLIMLQRTNYSLPGTIISSLIFFGALKSMQGMDKQNRQDIKHNYRTWGKGAGAELIEERLLESLPPEYKIIKDFNTGHGNIDFIVIGPTGIFAIEVKANKGIISVVNQQLFINEQLSEKDYLKQAFAEKAWLTDRLYSQFNERYEVVGILEFPNGKINTNTIHGKIDNIWIGGRGFHRYVMNKSPQTLTPEKVESIYSFIRSQEVKEGV